jgi:hexosaminidase
VYEYEPVPADFSPEQRQKVLGVEGCLWTENVYDTKQAEYMLFPRLLALADVAWAKPGQRQWPDFKRQLPSMLAWLDKYDTRYATSVFDPAIQILTDTVSKRQKCQFEQQIPFGQIHYTTDGSQPTLESNTYLR